MKIFIFEISFSDVVKLLDFIQFIYVLLVRISSLLPKSVCSYSQMTPSNYSDVRNGKWQFISVQIYVYKFLSLIENKIKSEGKIKLSKT